MRLKESFQPLQIVSFIFSKTFQIIKYYLSVVLPFCPKSQDTIMICCTATMCLRLHGQAHHRSSYPSLHRHPHHRVKQNRLLRPVIHRN